MISDIEGFIRKYHFRHPEFTKQTLFNHLWQRLQMMDEKTPLDNERFFSEYLSGGWGEQQAIDNKKRPD
ncbi:hypothetical protein [Klebsiella oxytoca]|nr:hypothetical protein [Klebsiella oxytoca]MDM4093169.1 hypothetical protein [Klebsiella oxytoca]